jgi:hypothetical protein
MKYIDVKWIHTNQDYPFRLVSELDDNAYEVRKLEFFGDGRIECASNLVCSGDTRLSDEPIPSITDINAQGEFDCVEIDKESFEELWASSVPSISVDNSLMRSVVFLDVDDVLAISREFTSYQVIMTFKSGDIDGWPELWQGLISPEARANLAKLHNEFFPQYVISSSWSSYLSQEQMQTIFRRTELGFVADNLHEHWTTPKGPRSSRFTEIENWIAEHGMADQSFLILDDKESGSSLEGSHLDRNGSVVLCEPWIGFVEERFVTAQRLLRAQLR